MHGGYIFAEKVVLQEDDVHRISTWCTPQIVFMLPSSSLSHACFICNIQTAYEDDFSMSIWYSISWDD